MAVVLDEEEKEVGDFCWDGVDKEDRRLIYLIEEDMLLLLLKVVVEEVEVDGNGMGRWE